jgi:hypothetical protein
MEMLRTVAAFESYWEGLRLSMVVEVVWSS